MMYFSTVTSISNILFYGWNTRTWTDVLIATIIICTITIIFEGLKVLKFTLVVYSKSQASISSVVYSGHDDQEHASTSSQADLLASLRIPVSTGHSRVKRIFMFLLESALHMLNFLYGYILMLLVMTYSIWFLLAILLGSGVGFFVCHPFAQHLAARYLPKKRTQRGCHGEDGKINREIETRVQRANAVTYQNNSFASATD